MKRILFLLIVMACSAPSTFATKKNVPIDEKPKKAINPNRPRAPARINVEAWIEENILTICFHNPEGEGIITLGEAQGYDAVELTFSTEGPIIIDLASYSEVTSFSITTETGKAYIGYL